MGHSLHHTLLGISLLQMKDSNKVTTVASPFAKVCQKEILHPEAGADAALGGLITLAVL